MRCRGAYGGQLYHPERACGGMITSVENLWTPVAFDCNELALIKRGVTGYRHDIHT
jgi:hypothetical protein